MILQAKEEQQGRATNLDAESQRDVVWASCPLPLPVLDLSLARISASAHRPGAEAGGVAPDRSHRDSLPNPQLDRHQGLTQPAR